MAARDAVEIKLGAQGESSAQNSRRFLLVGGVLTGVVALLHVAIIPGGPPWYRFFGAGERMAQLAARGSSAPAIVTATIAAIFSVWTLYALSGADVIRRLPYLRLVLLLIAAIYLARGIVGIPVVLFVDDPYTRQLRDRTTFMIVSSGISTFLGLCYAVGAAGVRYKAPASTLHRTPTRSV